MVLRLSSVLLTATLLSFSTSTSSPIPSATVGIKCSLWTLPESDPIFNVLLQAELIIEFLKNLQEKEKVLREENKILSSYLTKEENKRCSEIDTQPLFKYFISGKEKRIDMELVKREELMKENKFQQWRANDHISNRRFSETKIKNKLEIEVL